jgi:hypothetical protein
LSQELVAVADAPLAKAKLIELDALFELKSGGKQAEVQFNPDTLKVTYANQLAQQGAGGKAAGGNPPSGDQAGGASRQFVGSSTTKLALQLWFDVTGLGAGTAADVTKLTAAVGYFITPRPLGANKELLPPNARFAWGSFSFDGTFDSLEESFEFFSPDGRPLRAQVSFTMSRQDIKLEFTTAGSASGSGPGRRPLTPAPAGATLQGLAAGAGARWQAIAAANGIEDPLRLRPGQLVDLAPRFGF